jgi:hypothetical protein
MHRKRDRFRLTSALVVFACLLATGIAHTQELSDAEKARFKKLDSGPKVVDVAKYPADIQSGYALMEKKCAKCHSPARPINTRFVLPGEWERYIKRMVYKPDSKMTDDDGKKIYRFLVYDASVRKADSLRVHLGLLPADQRTAAIEKIKVLNPAFEPAK